MFIASYVRIYNSRFQMVCLFGVVRYVRIVSGQDLFNKATLVGMVIYCYFATWKYRTTVTRGLIGRKLPSIAPSVIILIPRYLTRHSYRCRSLY